MGITQPRLVLTAFGMVFVGAAMVIMTFLATASMGMDMNSWISSLASSASLDLSSVVLAKVPLLAEANSAGVYQERDAMPTIMETVSYTLRDFSKLDVYGSSADVAQWFCMLDNYLILVFCMVHKQP